MTEEDVVAVRERARAHRFGRLLGQRIAVHPHVVEVLAHVGADLAGYPGIHRLPAAAVLDRERRRIFLIARRPRGAEVAPQPRFLSARVVSTVRLRALGAGDRSRGVTVRELALGAMRFFDPTHVRHSRGKRPIGT